MLADGTNLFVGTLLKMLCIHLHPGTPFGIIPESRSSCPGFPSGPNQKRDVGQLKIAKSPSKPHRQLKKNGRLLVLDQGRPSRKCVSKKFLKFVLADNRCY